MGSSPSKRPLRKKATDDSPSAFASGTYDPHFGSSDPNITHQQIFDYFYDFCLTDRNYAPPGIPRSGNKNQDEAACAAWAANRLQRDVNPPPPNQPPPSSECGIFDLGACISEWLAAAWKGLKELWAIYWDCISDWYKWVWYKISSLWKDPPTTPPECPGVVCWFFALGFNAVAILLGGALLFAVFKAFGILLALPEKVAQTLDKIYQIVSGFFSSSLSFTVSVASYVQVMAANILYGGRNLLDFVLDLSDSIAAFTGASTKLVNINIFTLLGVCTGLLVAELMELEMSWHDSACHGWFNFFNFPFNFLSNLVLGITGKTILYYVFKFLILPFEVGTLGLSFIGCGVGYVFEEIWAQIKELL